ncbi:STN domain-containing protein, partial [Novosphingobium sp. 1949]
MSKLLRIAGIALVWSAGQPALVHAQERLPGAAHTARTAARRFDIGEQDLEGALQQLAMQSRRQIIFPPSLASGQRAPRVAGTMPLSRALDTLLSRSNLTYRLLGDGVIVI